MSVSRAGPVHPHRFDTANRPVACSRHPELLVAGNPKL